jgi:hypothetical protein
MRSRGGAGLRLTTTPGRSDSDLSNPGLYASPGKRRRDWFDVCQQIYWQKVVIQPGIGEGTLPANA